jgi:hypothetical protein
MKNIDIISELIEKEIMAKLFLWHVWVRFISYHVCTCRVPYGAPARYYRGNDEECGEEKHHRHALQHTPSTTLQHTCNTYRNTHIQSYTT